MNINIHSLSGEIDIFLPSFYSMIIASFKVLLTEWCYFQQLLWHLLILIGNGHSQAEGPDKMGFKENWSYAKIRLSVCWNIRNKS